MDAEKWLESLHEQGIIDEHTPAKTVSSPAVIGVPGEKSEGSKDVPKEPVCAGGRDNFYSILNPD